MNKIILMGRLTASPTAGVTAGGINWSKFNLAVSRETKNSQNSITDFISCSAWSGIATFVNNFLMKGSPVLIEGTLQTAKFTDKNGNQSYTYSVNVEKLKSLAFKQKIEVEQGPEKLEFEKVSNATETFIVEKTKNNDFDENPFNLEWPDSDDKPL